MMPGSSRRPSARCGWLSTSRLTRLMETLKTTREKCWRLLEKPWSTSLKNEQRLVLITRVSNYITEGLFVASKLIIFKASILKYFFLVKLTDYAEHLHANCVGWYIQTLQYQDGFFTFFTFKTGEDQFQISIFTCWQFIHTVLVL